MVFIVIFFWVNFQAIQSNPGTGLGNSSFMAHSLFNKVFSLSIPFSPIIYSLSKLLSKLLSELLKDTTALVKGIKLQFSVTEFIPRGLKCILVFCCFLSSKPDKMTANKIYTKIKK